MACMHEGHRKRMRERIKSGGLEGLQDHEILEWMLFHTVPRGDVNPLAHRLIDAFGSLSGVLEADAERLMGIQGVGESTALFLSNYLGVYKRYKQSRHHKKVLRFSDMDTVVEHIRDRMLEHKGEYLFALLLDDRLHILCCQAISEGTRGAVGVDVRKLATLCLNRNASFLVLAHNHPSDILLPSYNDVQTTIALRTSMGALGIHLLDHLIIGKDEYVSMAMSEEYSYIFKTQETKSNMP